MTLPIRLSSFLTMVLLCGLTAHCRAQAADANEMRVQLLSGKTGRPITNTHILLWRNVKLMTLDGTKINRGETTDGEGYATIPATDADTLTVSVDLHIACAKAAKTFSLMDVRARGIVSENTCSKRIHMFPQPGTLIFFVRDETFFEKMRH